MSLITYAESELKRAGLFDEDSNYSGKIGIAALEMIKQFSSEGHSEQSAGLCLSIFERLARFKPLSPIENPMIDGSFVDHTNISDRKSTFQSTRLSSLFSNDNGKTWYDIDRKVPLWKKIFSQRVAYVSFPYIPD